MSFINKMKLWSHFQLIAYGANSGLLIADYLTASVISDHQCASVVKRPKQAPFLS